MEPVATGQGIYRSSAAVAPRPGRDRYFDALRAAALVRVFAYHMFPVPWLAMIFPSMGVMFALGGSLMAASLQRSTEQAITGRLRRLLPALWVMGALVIPAMLWHGWDDRPDWTVLLLWLLPVAEPPSSSWAEPATGVLWYLVAYLWLVLLSPLLARCYRRARVLTAAAPLVLLAGWENTPVPVGETLASAVTDVLTFTTCWVLGFAHRHGDLRRIPLGALLPLSAVLITAGLGWTLTHPGEDGVDLAASPPAYAAYSAGFVLLLIRATPAMHWLTRYPALNAFVNLCNARAVTIYLWHNVAISLCFTVGAAISVERVGSDFLMAAYLGVAVVLLAGFVALLGWVEDLAARRPVRLLPRGVLTPGPPRQVPQWAGPT